MIDDTLEAFFLLPIPMHADLLPGLMSGLDKSLQQYILKAKSGCGIYLSHSIWSTKVVSYSIIV